MYILLLVFEKKCPIHFIPLKVIAFILHMNLAAVFASKSSVTGMSLSNDVNGHRWTVLQLSTPIQDLSPVQAHVDKLKTITF
jgi:hypothetical protein